MCIIIAKKKGILYTKEVLEENITTAWENNQDGAGIAFKKEGEEKIFISKGIFLLKDLLFILSKLNIQINDELIIHLRIGTSGLIDDSNTHPFIIADTLSEIALTKTGFVTQPVLTHNGVFGRFTKEESNYSDTIWFIKDFLGLKWLNAFLKEDTDKFLNLFKTVINYNKLAILYPDIPMKIINEDSFIVDKGILYSNNTYNKVPTYTKKYDWYDGYPSRKKKQYSLPLITVKKNHNKHYSECSNALNTNHFSDLLRKHKKENIYLVGKKNTSDVDKTFIILEVFDEYKTCKVNDISEIEEKNHEVRTFGYINMFFDIYTGLEYIEYLNKEEDMTEYEATFTTS